MGGHSDSGITSACALSDMTSVLLGNAFQQFLASLARPFLLAFSAHASAVPIWSCNFVLVCEHIFCSLSCVAGFCSAPPRPVKKARTTSAETRVRDFFMVIPPFLVEWLVKCCSLTSRFLASISPLGVLM